MKISKLIVAVALCASFSAIAAGKHDHGHEHEALHGGVVTEVKDVDLELVAQPDLIQLHLRDHGKPVDVANGSGKLTILSGAEKQEVELKPAGEKLEARGAFKVGAGTKLVAVVTVPGKPTLTARFALK
ncbi:MULTISPECIES: hypothetical protein [Denitromonas]|uniref:Copper chaperone PCu(A)C n=2 Tax=Denitromonas TaxID=139331 RepID=A0A557R3I2_9RHOO|nr:MULTISPECIES: hypothetical protein [Denitromonas]TVO59702.1 hypothetical protein FHP91_00315 [Denitromonas halophila]TVO59975.1 hypothetical protein FHP90_19055 [Denitromonas ohlonensis]TVO75059.1 hypothetical protein FHP89_14765 [Denitromonas ohlonensis]TVT49070.1 MAG: hypothetical protein FHP94_08205 [Denitromonas halophila]TVT69198.1 MAG: hypothetical protein FHP92_19705 [Denitromonas halophila]